MPDNEFYTPTDVDALRMENELLSFEVSFLKARLATGGRAARPEKSPGATTSAGRLVYLEGAETDLVLILKKLLNGPAGPLLRSRGPLKALEQRYLTSGNNDAPGSGGRVAYLEAAEADLLLLLKRISNSPLGPVLRRTRPSFRTLERRYL